MPLPGLIRDLANFAYPPRCVCCGEKGLDHLPALCGKCDDELDVLANIAMCPLCAMPVGSPGGDCPHCLGKGVHPFGRIVALGLFREPLRELIHHAKYHQRWILAEMLVDRLLELDRARYVLDYAQYLVAVPLHWSRHASRGYNQAEVIAGRLRNHNRRIHVVHPLARVKSTEPQTLTTSHAERAINLHHAFGLVDGRSVKGKHVVLVDDVTTTAATLKAAARALKAAARALKAAEPASLSAIVLAIADPQGRDFQVI